MSGLGATAFWLAVVAGMLIGLLAAATYFVIADYVALRKRERRLREAAIRDHG